MRETSCEAQINFIDITASSDATYASSTRQDISKFAFNDSNVAHNYATLELNQFVLDGTKELFTEDVTMGWYSDGQSSSNCEYDKSQVITIAFNSLHSTSGITLYFDDVVPQKFMIYYYNYDNVVAHKVYENTEDTKSIFCKCKASDYNRIVITILESMFPDTFVKLNYVLYGTQIIWTNEEIKEAKITESIDVTSATVAINSASISIIDTANNFDLASQDGEWNFIQQNQVVEIWEYLNGDKLFMGKMYIKSFDANKNVITFKLEDALSLLDQSRFIGGVMYTNKNAGTLISEILDNAGNVEYTIHEDVYQHTVTGYLAPQTHRQALQQVLFAIGATVDTTSSDTIKIFFPKISPSSYISRERKFDETKTTLDSYVSAIEGEYTSYIQNDKLTPVIKDTTYSQGVHTITFNQPYIGYTSTTATILESNLNCVKIQVTTEEPITIEAYPFNTQKQSYLTTVQDVEGGEVENTKSFKGMTLWETPMEKNRQLLSDFKYRKNVNMRYLLEGERVGDWVFVEQRDYPAHIIVTRIKSQTLDLTGGFIATANCVGWEFKADDFAYTGEIYTGERSLI